MISRFNLVLFLAVGWTTPTSASPAFSRQTGASCRLCHFQGFHSLSRYGRGFLMNGFCETNKMQERRME